MTCPELLHPLPITPSELTERQMAIVARVGRGLTNKRIAAELGVSVRWVQVVVSGIAYRVGMTPEQDERVVVALWWVRFANLPAFQKAS